MNIVQIHSGLGNQMFQYAFFLALRSVNPDCKLDVSNYRYRPSHNGYELQRVFGIAAPCATQAECDRLADVSKAFWPYIRRKLGIKRRTTGRLITEPNPAAGWCPEMLLYDNCYFLGYWQTERYFANIQGDVREAFQFCQPFSEQERLLAEQITDCNSVSVHIRQGDYLKPRRAADYNICTEAYYRKAIAYIRQNEQAARFFVFSDDPQIAQTFHCFPEDTIFVNAFRAEEAWRDMRLMSLCKHNIVANSSFSWWGGWLNANPDKRVIAPKIWFRSRPRPDIVPESWTRIETGG